MRYKVTTKLYVISVIIGITTAMFSYLLGVPFKSALGGFLVGQVLMIFAGIPFAVWIANLGEPRE